ncbi:DUF4190 domain-containing protein [Micromonospora chersina]|uniref:DUF4190 domain-containing protein n=1 Tax=Micromonospora chersina TaxID=47854 RepID=UPI0033D9B705
MTYPQPGLDPTRPQPPLPAALRPYPPVSAPSGVYAPVPALPYQGGGYPTGGQRLTVQPILTSGMATASLVLGILGVLGGWCLFGLPCVLAVILGHLALRETRDGMRSRHGMTVAGLVLATSSSVP